MRKIKLTIHYDGAGFSGWQRQPDRKTIQGQIEQAIEKLTGSKVSLYAASRTDAGVSALGQVAVMQIDCPIPTENLARAITDRLADDIAIAEAVEVSADFDLAGAVKSKLYRYAIYTGRVRPVLNRHCWHLPGNLDVKAMKKAAVRLVGKKDFKSFASAADTRENTIRVIYRCDVYSSCVVRDALCGKEKVYSCFRRNDNTQYAMRDAEYDNNWVYVEVEGDGFLYNMVRNIVGTLVEVGLGRWKPERMDKILEAKDRTAAGPIAPAAGLCLVWVKC